MERLQLLLNRATNPLNEELDVAACDAFIAELTENDETLSLPATKLLVMKIHSKNMKEALFTLDFLEECVENCGLRFRQEIGKFKFLNELIKLVSKKHLGDVTPKEIQTKILDILFTWTSNYPEQTKIKEAYDMLKTQGIVHQPIKNVLSTNNGTPPGRNMENRPKTMDVREMALCKLLKSKNPKDIEKANLLIQNIVREDERRSTMKVRREMEMKKVVENITLLNEMLDNFDKDATSDDEKGIINELVESCQMFLPMISKLVVDSEQNRDDLANILQINDKLTNVVARHSQIFEGNLKKHISQTQKNTSSSGLEDILGLNLNEINQNLSQENVMKELDDIFSKINEEPSSSENSKAYNSINDEILRPNKLSPNQVKPDMQHSVPSIEKSDSKYSALMNLEPKITTVHSTSQKESKTKTLLDLDSLVMGMKTKLLPQTSQENSEGSSNEILVEDKTTKDDSLLDTKSNKSNDDDDAILSSDDFSLDVIPGSLESKPLALADIHIDLDNVQPSSEPPRTVMDEINGLKIMLNFAKDRPRSDTIVIVISIINQGTATVKDFQFDASVKKPAKLRLLPASGTILKGVKPFRPPADGIMQVLLLSNPTGKPLNMISIVSYCVDEDPDPVKESIEVKDLPYICN